MANHSPGPPVQHASHMSNAGPACTRPTKQAPDVRGLLMADIWASLSNLIVPGVDCGASYGGAAHGLRHSAPLGPERPG